MPRALAASAAIGAMAALLLVGSAGTAHAVKASPPTLTCAGPCEFCLEMEGSLEGSAGRCVKCGLKPGCSYDASLSPGDNEFLNAHNAHRDKHCAPMLSWSAKLATAAQSYANSCKFVHDEKRGQVGENLYWRGPTLSPKDAVDSWYGEIKDYNFDAPKWPSSNSEPAIGHFTQIVWQTTTQVGCAVASCPPPAPPNKDNYNGPWQLAVCRYSPPGNINVNNPGQLAANVPRVSANACLKGSCRGACHSPTARPDIKTPVDLGGIFVQPGVVHAGCFGGMMMNAAGRCACPEGTLWQGRACAPSALLIDAVPLRVVPPTSVRPAIEPPRLPSTTQARTCPAERPNGVPPNCCPLYTSFRDGVCVRAAPPQQVPRTRVDVGTSGSDKVQARVCPPERPVGTPPNCCPAETVFNGQVCLRAAAQQMPRTGGSAGTSGSDKVQARGCPSERPVGSWPNCCPEGTSYANGRCLRKAQTQAPQQQPNVCPPDRPFGTYPNCCPPGTTYVNGACTGGGYNTSRDPPPFNSTRGKVEQVPSSKFPVPTQRQPDVMTKPKGPIFQVPKCPKGLTGPNCDQPVVN